MAGPKNELPCPCGSGTRHDECCGPIRRSVIERYTDEDLQQALVLATREAERPEYETWLASSDEEFFGDWIVEYEACDPEDEMQADLHEAHTLGRTLWVLFDRASAEGSTLAERLLERRGEKLLPGVRNALSALATSATRPYAIVAIQPERGFVLAELESGKQVWAGEPSAGALEIEGDLLLARIVRNGRGERTLLPDARNFAGEWQEYLRSSVASLREHAKDATEPGELAFWKQAGPALHQVWCATVYEPADEDPGPLELLRTTYRLLDAEDCARRLLASGEFHRAEEDTWEWTGAEGDDAAASGSLKREGGELYLVTLVRETHAALRARVEVLLGGVVEFVRTETIDLQRALGPGEGAEEPEDRGA